MDILDSIDKIIPFVFFIIWIFFGLFARSKKQRKPSRDKKTAGGGMGELGKTLRRVLEEMQQPVVVPEPEFETVSFDDEPPVETPLETPAGMEMETLPGEPEEQPDRREELPAPSAAASGGKKALLRQGIILSEILAPPIALRE